MEIRSIQKYIHTTPRKLRLVADMVRQMTPAQALVSLQFSSKYASTPLSKAIKTAMANAKQANLDPENLAFKTLEVNESMSIKRGRSGSKGMLSPYQKRMSHINIVLTDEIKVKNQNAKGKSATKKAKVAKRVEAN